MLSQRVAQIKILSQVKINRIPGSSYEEQKIFRELLESGMLEPSSQAENEFCYALTIRGEMFLQSLLGDFS